MVINVEHWRKYGIGEKVRNFKRDHAEKINTNDQCALNGVLWENWKRLPPQWNQQSGIYRRRLRRPGAINYNQGEIKKATKDPSIIHFVGERKPWKPGCPHPLRTRYEYYRAQVDPDFLAPTELEVAIASARKGKLRHYLKSIVYRTFLK
jgi:lipopolysaccharide biosynthesis glycosyltransferase